MEIEFFKEYAGAVEAVAKAAKTLTESIPDNDSGGYQDNPMMVRQSHATHCVHIAHQMWSQMYSEATAVRRMQRAVEQRQQERQAEIAASEAAMRAAQPQVPQSAEESNAESFLESVMRQISSGSRRPVLVAKMESDGKITRVSPRPRASAHDEQLMQELQSITCPCPYHRSAAINLKLELGIELTAEEQEFLTAAGFAAHHTDPPATGG